MDSESHFVVVIGEQIKIGWSFHPYRSAIPLSKMYFNIADAAGMILLS